ncbi:hypothetical protein DFH06DRAFT_1316600 [Mycena polygramma]|nr:hypothetical protein DFH06DRAFT_1316600 [Mycena polygramma]
MSTVSHPPKLPPELEREIFTIAAIFYGETIPRLMPRLLRVAHRVRAWIEPLLYGTLVFRKTRDTSFMRRFSALVRALHARPLTFVESQVRSIMWWHYYGEEKMEALLSLCSGLRNLALINLTPSMIPTLSTLPELQRLTLPASSGVLLNPPIPYSFATLTHLHIHGVGDLDLPWIIALPALTHFCIESLASTMLEALEELLLDCPKLQVCVYAVGFRLSTLSAPLMEDQRVVVLQLDLDNDNYVRDWKTGATGGRDFWVRAEEFLAKKKSDQSITTQVCEWD